jgi:hypothetical protein
MQKAGPVPDHSHAVAAECSRSRLRTLLVAIVAGATLALAAPAAEAARLYNGTSPFNQPIPDDAKTDPASDAMVQTLVDSFNARGFVVANHEYTVPVYYADADTPRYDVLTAGQPPGAHYDPLFVHNAPRIMRDVPIPDNAAPDPMEDGHMTIIDKSTRCEYDFYAARKDGDQWTALWGNRIRTTSDGVYPLGLSTRAVGFAPLAGMIWPDELQAGVIRHALMFAYPTTRAGGPVGQGTASDGKTFDPAAIPQGARVQLDPSLNLRRLGLTSYEMTIARALKRYGMILGDTGGALSLYAVGAQSWPTDPYPGLLEDDVYTYLANIPVDRFRVIETGSQKPVTPLAVLQSPCGKIDADPTPAFAPPVAPGGPPPELPDLLPPVEEPPATDAPPVADAPEEAPPAEPAAPAETDPPVVAGETTG